MKVTRKGLVKLGHNEIRVGNFVVGEENGKIKVSDISGVVSHRIDERIVKGQFVRMLYEGVKKKDEKAERGLQNYIAVMHNVLSCVPDTEFYEALMKAVEECLARHKDLYGIKDEVDKEEDDAVLNEEKEIAETEEAIRKEVGAKEERI